MGSLLKDVDRTQEEEDLKSINKILNPKGTDLIDQLQNLPSQSLMKILQGVMMMKRMRMTIICHLQQQHHQEKRQDKDLKGTPFLELFTQKVVVSNDLAKIFLLAPKILSGQFEDTKQEAKNKMNR